MPKVKLIGDDTIERLCALREKGLTIRQIAGQMGVPRATVHHYVRDVPVAGSALVLAETESDVHHLGVHLPVNVVCPCCGLEQAHITFCTHCGAVWMGTCGHGGDVVDDRHQGVDLGALERRPGDGHFYVSVVEAADGKPEGEEGGQR